MSRDARDCFGVQQKSGVGNWNNIFDDSLSEQSDLQIGTTVVDGSLREPPLSKARARAGAG